MVSLTAKGLIGIFNAREFGLVAASSVDNQPAIQAAVLAAEAAGGGQVWIPPDAGTVGVGSSIELYDDVELIVPAGVTVQLLPGRNVDVIKAASGQSARIRISGSGTIDGNRAAQTGASNGISLAGVADVRIEGVRVISCYSSGLVLDGCDRAKVDLLATDNGSHGLELIDVTRSEIRARSYDNCKVATAGTADGIHLSGECTDNTIVSPICYDSAGGSGRQGYGVREAAASSCDRNVISAGALESNKTGAYSLVGAASKSLDNTPLPVSSYAQAGLPAASSAGRLARVTDGVRGLWMDNGSQWVSLGGEAANVKEFGAIGDGTADDTAAIQAALTAGSLVVFPPGTYKITATLNLSTGHTLRGAPGRSTLQAAGGAAGINMLSAVSVTDVTIEGLTIDGNKAAVTDSNGTGILLASTVRVRIRDCEVRDCAGVGIWSLTACDRLQIIDCHVSGCGKAGTTNGQGIHVKESISGVMIRGCRVSGCLTDGILVNGAGEAAADVTVSECRVEDNTVIGIFIAGTAAAPVYRVVVTGNTCTGNRDNILLGGCAKGTVANNVANDSAGDQAGDGIVIDSCSDVAVSGNVVTGNRARGIYISKESIPTLGSYRIAVNGNFVGFNNRDEIAGLAGIDIFESFEVSVVGNTITDENGAARQVYGIAQDAVSALCTFVGNNINYQLTGPTNILGYSNNVGLNTA